MKRINRNVFYAGVLLLALSFPAEAQQPKKVPLIGVLSGSCSPTATTPDPNADAFRQGLRDLGYIEGKNILVEYRYTEGISFGAAFSVRKRAGPDSCL